MICCLLSALFAGNLVAAGPMASAMMRRPRAILGVLLAVLLVGVAAVAPAAAEHAAHYAARAEANHRSIIAEILAAPLCSGGRTP